MASNENQGRASQPPGYLHSTAGLLLFFCPEVKMDILIQVVSLCFLYPSGSSPSLLHATHIGTIAINVHMHGSTTQFNCIQMHTSCNIVLHCVMLQRISMNLYKFNVFYTGILDVDACEEDMNVL